MERRKFITVIDATALAAPVISSIASCGPGNETFEGHNFPDLPYDFNSLEPYIDARTMIQNIIKVILISLLQQLKMPS